MCLPRGAVAGSHPRERIGSTDALPTWKAHAIAANLDPSWVNDLD
jgi:hypothetical protein